MVTETIQVTSLTEAARVVFEEGTVNSTGNQSISSDVAHKIITTLWDLENAGQKGLLDKLLVLSGGVRFSSFEEGDASYEELKNHMYASYILDEEGRLLPAASAVIHDVLLKRSDAQEFTINHAHYTEQFQERAERLSSGQLDIAEDAEDVRKYTVSDDVSSGVSVTTRREASGLRYSLVLK